MKNPNPCAKDCPRRAAGCAVTCPEWAAYQEERDAGYAERARKCVNMLYTPGGIGVVKRHARDQKRGRQHWK